MLLDGLKSYISDQNNVKMISCLNQLKEEFQFNPTKLEQLTLVLYSFQDAVNNTLRLQNIKPHWMFALDNLVRSAVQAAVTDLIPEYGEELAEENSGNEAVVNQVLPHPIPQVEIDRE